MGDAEGSDTGLGNGMLTSSTAVNRRQRALLVRVIAQPAMRRYTLDVAALARVPEPRMTLRPDAPVTMLVSVRPGKTLTAADALPSVGQVIS
jgi:hypothetical protein